MPSFHTGAFPRIFQSCIVALLLHFCCIYVDYLLFRICCIMLRCYGIYAELIVIAFVLSCGPGEYAQWRIEVTTLLPSFRRGALPLILIDCILLCSAITVML